MKQSFKNKRVFRPLLSVGIAVLFLPQITIAAISSVTDTACNARLEVGVSGSQRTSSLSATDCQDRSLTTSSGFALASSSPTDSAAVDSSAMVSAGGELYEAFVASARDAAVLLTPNRALMMSRLVSGNSDSVDWNMGLAVQSVSSATNAWLTGTYVLLRANREVRAVTNPANQTNAGLSEVFDPTTLRITFDGNSGCSVTDHSSWLSYSLTTDPNGAFSQPDGSNYGLHQAVYAGEGYVGAGGVHPDSNLTFTGCDYTLGSDGLLLITYQYNDGDAVGHIVENAYYLSADLRYMVSTSAGSDLYRGFEVGLRVAAISGTPQEVNDSVAGSYLFNAPLLELQGSTSATADNVNQNSEKVTQCMSRGSLVLSTGASGITSGWNGCTFSMSSTCAVRGEEGTPGSVVISHYTGEGTNAATTCEFSVASNGDINFSVNLMTAEGAQDVTFSGSVADNNETLVLKGKYEGTDMANPSNSNPPERVIKNDLLLTALVAIKYEGSLVADADSDGLSNLDEFLYADYVAPSATKNDFNNDGIADLLIRSTSGGNWRLFNMGATGVALGDSTYAAYTTADWQLVASEDFDADGDTDLLLRNGSTGAWRMFVTEAGAVFSDSAFTAYSNIAWEVVSVADYNGDGTKDILLHSNAGGGWRVFYISNGAVSGNAAMALYASGWDLKYDGDIDGDGDADIILRRASDGYWRLFTVASGVVFSNSAVALYQNQNWQVQFVADLDLDGDDDLVMRNVSSGYNWRTFAASSGVIGANTKFSMYENAGWSFDHVNDVDADGDKDVVLRGSTGGWRLFLTSGLDVPSNTSLALYANSAWQTAGLADVDGNGTEDVILNNTSSGAWRAFMINAGSVSSDTNPGLYQNTDWTLQDR